ncbi:hypothetical protein QTP88_014809 [Uroleucon formosanum]
MAPPGPPLWAPLATPTEEVWKNSEIGFRELWNFPNCIGSIDGKHVSIKCPPKTGSSFFCYKNFFSIVLLGIVDPNYKFLIVDIGSYGRHSDSSIFENSSFYREFIQGKTILPPKPLPGTTTPVPHVFVGDKGFKLETFLMRLFPRAVVAQDEAKKVFNKRLSRARRVVENTFGILAQKWRVFFRPIELEVDTAEHVVKAACCLHNYLRSTSTIENESEEDAILPINVFSDTQRIRERSSIVATSVRKNFVNYFNYLRNETIDQYKIQNQHYSSKATPAFISGNVKKINYTISLFGPADRFITEQYRSDTRSADRATGSLGCDVSGLEVFGMVSTKSTNNDQGCTSTLKSLYRKVSKIISLKSLN